MSEVKKLTREEMVNRWLKRFPIPEVYNYSKRKFIENKKDFISYEMETAPLSAVAPTAYCTRMGKADSSYRVFIPKCPESARIPFEMHEFGHIVFQHLRFEKLKEDQVIQRIESHWDKFSQFIDYEGNESIKSVLETRKALVHQIMNVAMDFEVNSKIFPTREERDANFGAKENFLIREAIKNCQTQKDFNKIRDFYKNKKKNPQLKFCKFPDPADYDYPDGLDFMTYIELILQEPEKFLKNQKNDPNLDHQFGGENQPKINTNQNNQGNQPNQSQQNPSQSGQSTQNNNQIDNQSNSQSSTNNSNSSAGNQSKNQNSQSSEAQDQSSSNNSKNQSSAESQSNDQDKKSAQQISTSSNRKLLTASELKQMALQADMKDTIDQASRMVSTCPKAASNSGIGDNEDFDYIYSPAVSVSKEIDKFIKRICVMQDKIGVHQDTLYNYNRGKLNGSFLVPKTLQNHTIRYGNIYAIIDVSGSVDEMAVIKIVNCLKKSKGYLGDKSKIIFWNTSFVGEYNLKSRDDCKVPVGGGTSIATGIYYVNNNYIKHPTDKILIVSDFEDYMSEWEEALKEVKCETYAINWDYQVSDNFEIRNQFAKPNPNETYYSYNEKQNYEALKKLTIAHVNMNDINQN